MGYFVNTTGIDFTIPKENMDKAYRAMCELNKDDSEKMGGAFGNLENTEDITGSSSVSTNPNKWYMWMPWNYDEVCKNAAEIFSALGFEVAEDEDGNLSLLWYEDKSGQEDLFLKAVSQYVSPGSYIEWSGEDGYLYRHEFDGEKMEVKVGTVVWKPIFS